MIVFRWWRMEDPGEVIVFRWWRMEDPGEVIVFRWWGWSWLGTYGTSPAIGRAPGPEPPLVAQAAAQVGQEAPIPLYEHSAYRAQQIGWRAL